MTAARLKSTQADLLILGAAVIWGLAFYFQKTAMSHIGPLLFVGLRGAVACLTLMPLAYIEHRNARLERKTETTALLKFALLGGSVFFVAAAIQQLGIRTTTITNTGFLTALYVVATPFVYWLFAGTAPNRNIWGAVVLAFVGTWCLSGGSIGAFSIGDWLVAGAATVWAGHMVTTGQASQLGLPLSYTCVQFLVVAMLALPSAYVFEVVDLSAILAAGDSIIYVGVLSSAFTFAAMAVALRHISAPRAAVLLSVEVVVTATAGYLLLGERLSSLGLLGAAAILGAIVLVRLRSNS